MAESERRGVSLWKRLPSVLRWRCRSAFSSSSARATLFYRILPASGVMLFTLPLATAVQRRSSVQFSPVFPAAEGCRAAFSALAPRMPQPARCLPASLARFLVGLSFKS